jgi:hypothetical protein
MLRSAVLTGVLFVFALGASVANAGSITQLYNTGFDSSGNTYADGTTTNSPWYLNSAPQGTPNLVVRNSTGGAPITTVPWAGDSSTSQWVGPADGSGNLDSAAEAGTYIYETTFQASGNVSTLSLTGQWVTAGGAGFRVTLNNYAVAVGNTTSGVPTQWQTGLNITNGFQTGTNVLDFYVNTTDPGYTGIRVELTPHGTSAGGGGGSVPEPSTLLLWGTVMGGAFAFRKKWAR